VELAESRQQIKSCCDVKDRRIGDEVENNNTIQNHGRFSFFRISSSLRLSTGSERFSTPLESIGSVSAAQQKYEDKPVGHKQGRIEPR
jgi:hypothetical protein